jgi:uracil-DNA glycosylase
LPWAQQGVLLLNAFLTVRKKQPASHRDIGWETFTNEVIRIISEQKEHVVFLLWGKFAQGKRVLIDRSKHLVLEAAHPSPYSANSGFFGCRHFSKTNAYLKSHGKQPVNWEL